MHSATKYIDGHGRCLGGAVLGDAEHIQKLVQFMRTAGTSMSPFNAWVFAKSLETLSLRMRAHSAGALEIARWLDADPRVQRVFFGGLPSHPQYALIQRQQSDWGGMLALALGGGRRARLALY